MSWKCNEGIENKIKHNAEYKYSEHDHISLWFTFIGLSILID